MSEWKPIDSAPKDGTWVLVPYPIWLDGNDTPTPSEFDVLRVRWNGVGWDVGGWLLHEMPLVWQALPEPPAVSTWHW
ncbi:hypothetical protein ACVWZK_006387 [Bradyrhizobium sp. GM0.4]